MLSASAFLAVLSGAPFIITPFPMPALNAVGAIDHALLFVSVSMILLALVAVVALDSLALDVRDEAILGPLRIPAAPAIVGAKLAAMGAVAGAVLLALNGPSSVLHASAVVAQLRVSVPGALRLKCTRTRWPAAPRAPSASAPFWRCARCAAPPWGPGGRRCRRACRRC